MPKDDLQDKGYAKREEELRAREEQMVLREELIVRETEAMHSEKKIEKHKLEGRVQELESAIKQGGVSGRVQRGDNVTVKRGDFLIYKAKQGGVDLIQGGWFKCQKDDKVSRDLPTMAVSNKGFIYDSEVGMPYHQVDMKSYKVFWKDPDKPQVVSDGLPKPIIITSEPQLQVAGV